MEEACGVCLTSHVRVARCVDGQKRCDGCFREWIRAQEKRANAGLRNDVLEVLGNLRELQGWIGALDADSPPGSWRVEAMGCLALDAVRQLTRATLGPDEPSSSGARSAS